MSDETVNIRIPDPLDLTQYRIQVGDTVEFIEKMTGTQDDLDAFSGQLNLTVADMQSAADQISTRYTQILQTGQQVADDKSTVQQLRTETGQDRVLAQQAATTATAKANIATGAAGSASDSASVASAAVQSSGENAAAASQAAIVSGQQRQLAEAAAQQAAQSALEAGPTNLSFSRTATTLTVQSSTGDDTALPAATTALAGLMSAADKQLLGSRQAQLVSGTNIKTVNGVSLLGSGDIAIAPTAAQVLSQYATAAYQAVGTYILAGFTTMTGFNGGETYAGGFLYPAGLSQTGYLNSSGINGFSPNGGTVQMYVTYSGTLPGTWRLMCRPYGQSNALVFGLFLRIA